MKTTVSMSYITINRTLRVVLSYLNKFSGVQIPPNLKSDPGYKSQKALIRKDWDEQGMKAVIPAEAVQEKILNLLTYTSHKNPEKYNQHKKEVLSWIHDVASEGKSNIFDKYNNDVTIEELLEDLNHFEENKKLGDKKLTKEELHIFNRVKVLKDFGDGFQWVFAVDEKGGPVGHLPQSVCNKTMDHCGNAPTKAKGDIYYELRQNSRPQVTVIVDGDHKIKESKGYGNEIPKNKKELIPYMKWFFDQEHIKGVSYDKGYARDKNFNIVQLLSEDPEYVKHVEKNKPHLIHKEVDKPILDWKRKLNSGEVTTNEVRHAFAKRQINLEQLRGILGYFPFNEKELLKYVESGRLTAIDIGNTDTKYLTPKVQEALLAKDRNAGKIFFHIKEAVPSFKLSEDESFLKSLVKDYPKNIKHIKNPSEAVQLEAVNQDSNTIEHIEKPSEAVQLAAVNKDGHAINHIKNPSEKVQLAAVEQNGHAIKHIKNPSEAAQLEAVTKNGKALESIENPSEKVQLAAVTIDGLLLKYIKNPSEAVQLAAKKQLEAVK